VNAFFVIEKDDPPSMNFSRNIEVAFSSVYVGHQFMCNVKEIFFRNAYLLRYVKV
jgi:hypothetical protein